MAQTRYFNCDKCETGIVRLIRKERGNTISLDVKDCDKCKGFTGLKGLTKLTEIITPPTNNNQANHN